MNRVFRLFHLCSQMPYTGYNTLHPNTLGMMPYTHIIFDTEGVSALSNALHRNDAVLGVRPVAIFPVEP